MFIVQKIDNFGKTVISLNLTLANAKTAMTNSALNLGKAKGDKIEEGIFVIFSDMGAVVQKNIVMSVEDKGWIYNGTKEEIKTELIAEYFIIEIAKDVKKRYDSECVAATKEQQSKIILDLIGKYFPKKVAANKEKRTKLSG